MNPHALSVPALVLALAGMAHAQAPVPPIEKSVPADAPKIDFASVDADANGRLSKEETRIVADLAAAFDRLDADRDSFISKQEYLRWDRAGKVEGPRRDPATGPSGSAGAQHVPDPGK